MVGEDLNKTDVLEPKCPGCAATLVYGENTSYNDEVGVHQCRLCGTLLR